MQLASKMWSGLLQSKRCFSYLLLITLGIFLLVNFKKEEDRIVIPPDATEYRSLLDDIADEVPQLPMLNWSLNFRGGYNKTCARYPKFLKLNIVNQYWQSLYTSDGAFHLFGAYFDDRGDDMYVRILGMVDRVEPIIPTWCQFWYPSNKSMIIINVSSYNYIWYKEWGNYESGSLQPYLLSCKLPPDISTKPESVSLVEHPCDNSTTNLRVNYNKPAVKKDVAVCVKGLDFLHEDKSVRLVEWIELLHLLGADQIFMYNLDSHPNITKVLKHYQALNKVHVTQLSLPGNLPNSPAHRTYYLQHDTTSKRKNEVIPYNDCFYKHMYEYRYIALLDIDEVIVPKKVDTWSELLATLNRTGVASFYFRNSYFLDPLLPTFFKDIPPYMHMLQHVYRTHNFTLPLEYVKCFHSTENILTLHNHFPIHCVKGRCRNKAVSIQDATMHHYRATCVSQLAKSCDELKKTAVMDNSVWRYKVELIKSVTSTLKKLGLVA